jgi:hypothetical protein
MARIVWKEQEREKVFKELFLMLRGEQALPLRERYALVPKWREAQERALPVARLRSFMSEDEKKDLVRRLNRANEEKDRVDFLAQKAAEEKAASVPQEAVSEADKLLSVLRPVQAAAAKPITVKPIAVSMDLNDDAVEPQAEELEQIPAQSVDEAKAEPFKVTPQEMIAAGLTALMSQSEANITAMIVPALISKLDALTVLVSHQARQISELQDVVLEVLTKPAVKEEIAAKPLTHPAEVNKPRVAILGLFPNDRQELLSVFSNIFDLKLYFGDENVDPSFPHCDKIFFMVERSRHPTYYKIKEAIKNQDAKRFVHVNGSISSLKRELYKFLDEYKKGSK